MLPSATLLTQLAPKGSPLTSWLGPSDWPNPGFSLCRHPSILRLNPNRQLLSCTDS